MEKPKEQKLRTEQQNKALHLYFQWLADELNNAGLDMRKTLKPEIDIPWSKSSVKEYMWKPVQKMVLDKNSTTQLKKGEKEIDKVYDTLNRYLLEKFGVHIPFPSIESFLLKTELKEKYGNKN